MNDILIKKNICEICGQDKDSGMCVCDLELDLSDETMDDQIPMEPEQNPVIADLTDEEKEVYKQVLEKQKEIDPILNGFSSLEEKPSQEQIDAWKQQHGKVFTIGLSEDEFFIFRPLRRLEWRNLMKALAQQQDEMKKKEAIFKRGTLWPNITPDYLAKSPAGTAETMYEMILQASNFLLPQEALACVRRL